MKLGKSSLRYGLQAALILVAAGALIVSRQWMGQTADLTALTETAIAVVAIYGVISGILNFMIDRRDWRLLSSARDIDLLALKAKAQTDALTGLLNREASVDQITQFLKNEGRPHGHALLIVDLDNFKSINDSFGHFEGDKVLKTQAAKIRDIFRSVDIVGRLGGDEFIILMKYTEAKSFIQRKAVELRAELEYIMSGGDVTVTVTGSIGIAIYNGDAKAFDTLYKEADEALYKAKLSGKNRHCYFNEPADEADPDEDRCRSGQALTESSAFIQLQALIDNIDGGIALLEVGDAIRAIFLSHSYVKQMNLSYNGIKQADNKVFDLIYKDDIAQVEEALRSGASSGKPTEAVFRRATDTGKTKWYHLRAVRIQYENSDIPVLIAIVTDVTNLKETELNFRAQKRQLETVLRISRVVTFEVDIVNHTLIVADPTIVKYGIDAHIIENMPDVLIDGGAIHPDSIDECRRMYNEIYAGVPEGSAIIRTLKMNGQYTIERFTYFTVFDESGRPVKAVGVDEGLETRSEINMRVELLERQIRYNSDNMLLVVKVILRTDCFELLKADGVTEELVKKARTFTEFLELWLTNLADEGVRDRLRQAFGINGLQRSFNEGSTLIVDEYFVGGAGDSLCYRSISATLYINQMNGDTYAFIRIRDVTRRKQLENELHINLLREPKMMLYYPEALSDMADALRQKADRTLPYAVVLISMENYENMLHLYGSLMMNELLVGFIGKIRMIVFAEHLDSYDGMGTVTIVIPEVYAGGWLRQLMEKTIRHLKNPAFFQLHEELYADYRCGIALSEGSASFNELCGRAHEALRASDGVNNVKFHNHLKESDPFTRTDSGQ